MAVGHYDDDLPATVREGIKQWVLLDRVWNPKTGNDVNLRTQEGYRVLGYRDGRYVMGRKKSTQEIADIIAKNKQLEADLAHNRKCYVNDIGEINQDRVALDQQVASLNERLMIAKEDCERMRRRAVRIESDLALVRNEIGCARYREITGNDRD